MNSKKVKNLHIFLLVLFSLNFFSAKFSQTGFIKFITFSYLFITVIISLPFFIRKGNGLVSSVQILSFSVLFSTIICYITWGQSIVLSLSTVPYLIWFVFFYLKKIKYPIGNIENIVLIYGFIYIILYLFQSFNNDIVYFGFKEEFVEDRGVIRINFPGGGVFFLSYFICLNKTSEKDYRKWLFYIYLMLGLTVTLLQVTRQNIIILLIITFFHILTKASVAKKILASIIFFIITIMFLSLDNSISNGLIEAQKETVSDGNQYIRILAGKYFLINFSPSFLSRVFGNGFPNNTSTYGKYTTYLEDTYGYYITDVGLIGLYAMFGFFAVAAYLVIFSKCLYMKIPNKYYYLKYYNFLLILTSLTSDFCFSINFLITNIFVIYCYQVLYDEKKYMIMNSQINSIHNNI